MMRRASTTAATIIAVLGLVVAGTANAGYVEATYDLAGSTFSTTSLLGPDTDQVTGQLVVRYSAASINAPQLGPA